jgi:hypothetical protein
MAERVMCTYKMKIGSILKGCVCVCRHELLHGSSQVARCEEAVGGPDEEKLQSTEEEFTAAPHTHPDIRILTHCSGTRVSSCH